MGIPSALSSRVRTGHGVLVAGMGFFDPPAVRSWEPLLRRLAEKHASSAPAARDSARVVLDLIARGRLGAALAWLRQRLPEEAITQVLGEAQPLAGAPSSSVTLATRLPWRGVVTTTFDDAWDRTLKNGRARRLDGRQLADAGRIEDGVNPFLVHALGTLGDAESICFSPADLRRRPAPGAVAGFLRSIFAERSFVFAGFRPGDPDLRLVIEHMLGGAPTRAEHFLVLPDSDGASDAELLAEIAGADLDLVPVSYGGSLEELLREWTEEGEGKPERSSGNGAGRSGVEVRTDAVALAALGDWVREQHAHIEATPPFERAPMFERMGDVYRDRLRNPVQAISYYRSSLMHEPARRSVLAKLAELYTTHKHWPAAEDTLVRLASTEATSEARAHVLCQAAGIALDELDKPARAAQILERALDEAPDMPEVFETLERLLNQEKNWQGLARLYQKMARELEADGPGRAVKIRAMDGLAELAQRFSKDPKVALRALEAADNIDPVNAERKALMAGLYQQSGPEQLERAVAMHHAAIATDPDRFTSYKALADLYRSAGENDRLWCVAATLTFLRKADDELREVYERGKGARSGPVVRPFNSDVWARVAHPDEDRDFSALFGVLGPVLAGVQAVPIEMLGLRPDERVDASWAETPVGRALSLVCRAFDTPPLHVYVRPAERRPAILRVVRTGNDLVPTLLLGAPLLGKNDPIEAMFTLARSLVLLRPERIVCAMESGRAVAHIGLEAALQMAGLKPPSESRRQDVERMTADLGTLLPQATRDHIVAGARRLIAKQGGAFPDVDRWCSAVELSAARAAFVMVNDLVVAARALAAEASAGHALPAKQRLKDLVGFSISETYFEARRALGLGRS